MGVQLTYVEDDIRYKIYPYTRDFELKSVEKGILQIGYCRMINERLFFVEKRYKVTEPWYRFNTYTYWWADYRLKGLINTSRKNTEVDMRNLIKNTADVVKEEFGIRSS